MANEWDKLNAQTPPTAQELSAFVNHPLWEEFCTYLEETYGGKPVIAFSRCSVPGWNVKYRKAGRALSTLYPMQGYFIALVVLTEPMWVAMEQLLPCLTPYVQELYKHTKAGMGQKWLMIEVRDAAVLEDVKQCVALRQRKW